MRTALKLPGIFSAAEREKGRPAASALYQRISDSEELPAPFGDSPRTMGELRRQFSSTLARCRRGAHLLPPTGPATRGAPTPSRVRRWRSNHRGGDYLRVIAACQGGKTRRKPRRQRASNCARRGSVDADNRETST